MVGGIERGSVNLRDEGWVEERVKVRGEGRRGEEIWICWK